MRSASSQVPERYAQAVIAKACRVSAIFSGLAT
jgi:hypothetical protein